MSAANLTDVLLTLNLLIFLKPALLVVIGLYLIFALVMIRQVGLMSTFLTSGSTPIFRTLSWLHFVFAVVLFVFVLLFV